MTTKEEALNSAILIATTGSHAYGLNHANSDLDQMGVFVAPTVKVAGLRWSTHSESWTNTSPEGDDLTLHEIGKYLRLTLGGNPTLVELLFMNDYTTLSEEGQVLVGLRDAIVSEPPLRKSYYGYAISQYKRLEAEEDFKPKMARHTLRIARQGYDLLTKGFFNVKVSDPQEYFDLTEMPKEDMLEKLATEIQKIRDCKTVLQAEPDIKLVTEFLEYVRRANL